MEKIGTKFEINIIYDQLMSKIWHTCYRTLVFHLSFSPVKQSVDSNCLDYLYRCEHCNCTMLFGNLLQWFAGHQISIHQIHILFVAPYVAGFRTILWVWLHNKLLTVSCCHGNIITNCHVNPINLPVSHHLGTWCAATYLTVVSSMDTAFEIHIVHCTVYCYVNHLVSYDVLSL